MRTITQLRQSLLTLLMMLTPIMMWGATENGIILKCTKTGHIYDAQTFVINTGTAYGYGYETSANYNKVWGAPNKDASGHNWYENAYKVEDECTSYDNKTNNEKVKWTTRQSPFEGWINDDIMGEFYMRRTFTFNGVLTKNVTLYCGHDDAPAEYYLNGQLIFSVNDGWYNDCTYSLTEEQKKLIKTDGTQNLLACHIHNNWGGSFADCGLTGGTLAGAIQFEDDNTRTICEQHFDANGDGVFTEEEAAMVTSLGGVFAYTNITAFPELKYFTKLKSIGDEEFKYCTGLSVLNIPSGVSTIGSSAFYGSGIRFITLPETLKTIQTNAFAHCNALRVIHCNTTVPAQLGSNVFDGTDQSYISVYVPVGSVANYKAAAQWNKSRSIKEYETAETGLVDLGLPSGTLWTSKNIGAVNEEDNGGYFSWGEIAEKNSYTYSNYTYYPTDPMADLDAKHDVATVFLGEDYWLPSYEEWKELIDECEWTLDYKNGKQGYHVYGPSGKSIFLPSNGDINGTTADVAQTAAYGSYWGRTSYTPNPNASIETIATELVFGFSDYGFGFGSTGYRFCGRGARAVFNPRRNLLTELTDLYKTCEEYNFSSKEARNQYGKKELATIEEAMQKATDILDNNQGKTNTEINTTTKELRDALSCTLASKGKHCTITDGTKASDIANSGFAKLSYERTFDDTCWQALYVPFILNYSDWNATFDIAEINNFHQYDTDGDNKPDVTELEIFIIDNGCTEPNKPYLIRAKSRGKYQIEVTDGWVYPLEENTIFCASTKMLYNFSGNYQSNYAITDSEYYTLKDNELVKTKTPVAPMRWFMTAKSQAQSKADAPARIRIRTTNDYVDSIEVPTQQQTKSHLYDLQGRKVTKTTSGIYIQNGRKVLR